MSSGIWTPPNITPVCQNAQAPLLACSQVGYMYLTLLTQLFGRSIDDVPRNPYQHPNQDIYHSVYSASLTSPNFSPFDQFGHHQPITPIKPATGPGFRAMYGDDSQVEHKMHFHSYGPKGSYGYAETSIFMKPNLEYKRSRYGIEDPSYFSKFDSSNPIFDYNFQRKSDYEDYDEETADSKKVTVADTTTTSGVTEKVELKKEKKEKGSSRSRKKRQAPEIFDFIIVGAGSAGCVVANRLSEVKKWKILLLEAGPEEPEITSVPSLAPALDSSSIDWMYRTQPEEMTCRAHAGQTCPWFSGRVMGGSSAINYLVYMRGNRKDYNDWAALGNNGWSYDEVLPYFKKSECNRDTDVDEEYHGNYGPMNVERFEYRDSNVVMLTNAFQETGLPLVDANGKTQIGTMIVQSTSKDGRRMSTNSAFIRPVRKKRSNLIIRTNAQVTKVLINSLKNIAYGVKYFSNDKWFRVHARKEVVLCAGGLNSPKILMLSGVGPARDLKALGINVVNNLKVGFNLHDHATTDAMLMSLTNKTSTLISPKRLFREVRKYYLTDKPSGPLSATGPLYVTAFVRTPFADEDETVPDIQYHFDGRHLRDFYADPTTYLSTRIFPFSYYDSINVRPILLLPRSRGFLTLNRTHPVFGQPLIYPRFFTDKRDIDTLVAALSMITELEKTKAFIDNGVEFVKRPVQACNYFQWGTYDYYFCLLRSYTSTIFHPSGTCKMGPLSDKTAVVDPRLRVYGIKHLRVADASIMPNIVRGNTNAPVMMIGEKVSDMIKADWWHYT